MKKILFLFALLMTIIIGAKADDVYKLQLNGANVEIINGTQSTTPTYFTWSSKHNFNTKFNGCTYDGVSYTSGLKMEGATEVYFTTTAASSTVVIVMSTWSNRADNVALDGTQVSNGDTGTTGCQIFTISDVEAGDHTIARSGSECGLFAVTVTEAGTSSDPKITVASTASVTATESGVAATVEVPVTGANLTGSTLTATLSDAPAGMSVALDQDEISEGGAISATATVSYSATENANGTATLTFSDGTTEKEVTITYAALVTKSELQSISDAKTWTFPTSVTLELTDATTPGKYDEYYTYADIATLNGNDLGTFDGTTLAFSGQYPYRGDNGAQNCNLQFITTVPGTVTVEFSNTSGSNKERWVKVNDTTGEVEADGTTHRTEDFTVAAGTVTISHVKADGTLSGGLRFYSVTFTPATTETITIPEEGVLTYVTQNALDFSTQNGAFKAYVPTSVNEAKTSVATAEVTSVPAGTALLLKGAAGAYDVEIAESATAPAANLFQVSDGSVAGGDNIFAYHKTNKKFMKVASTVTIPEGKCYLVIDGVTSTPGAPASLDIDFDGEATAINNVDANENANAAAPVKVIKNGKLYIGNYNVAGQQVK